MSKLRIVAVEKNRPRKATARITSDEVERLKEIREEIIELMHEAKSLVRGTEEEHRFRAYPYGNIMSMLGTDEYPQHSTTFEEIIQDLEADLN
jgi:hypothetical protein